MTGKRQILDVLTRSRLLEVARAFEVAGLTGRPKEEIVASLARSRAIDTERLLGVLKRTELEAAARPGSTTGAGARRPSLPACSGAIGPVPRPLQISPANPLPAKADDVRTEEAAR